MESRATQPGRWNEVRELFLELAELDPEERSAELERLRSQDPDLGNWVARLLEQDLGPEAEVPFVSRRLGPYETTRLLARGGMGEVFVARRIDGEFEREVAIKLMHPGERSEGLLQRFLRERQTLARLDHEYVAGLLDGGTTEQGEPYLVMEFVEGEPLDSFCARLDPPERLVVFQRLCAAVRHAHERGVIHRDLKPNNILVRSDGTPRLLDFGIALPREGDTTPGGPLTRTGHRLFTPEFASPEQVRGQEVTEASDLFALGVLLYELLADVRPWSPNLGVHELEREICEKDPLPPSRCRQGTTRRRISGDLDTITLKCLAKRPEDRYLSVAELGIDLERHLTGFPIHARRTGLFQRAWRYGRRKPGWVAGVGGIVLAAVAGVFAWKAESARRERHDELLETIEARIEAGRNLRGQGKLGKAQAELEAVLETLTEIPREMYLRAYAVSQLAVVANFGARYHDALELAGEASKLVPEQDPRSLRLRASLLFARAYAHEMLEDLPEAERLTRECLDYCREHLSPGHELTVDSLLGLVAIHRKRRDYPAAERTLKEAVAEARRAEDPRNIELGHALNLWGLALADIQLHEEAVEKFEEAMSILTWHHAEGHPTTAQIRTNLGVSLMHLGRFEEAEGHHQRALEARRRIGNETAIALAMEHLGEVAMASGDYALAGERFEEVLEVRLRILEPNHPYFAKSNCLIGILHELKGDAEVARFALEEALDHMGNGVVLEGSYEARARFHLGRLLIMEGEPELARTHLERALELNREHLGEQHSDTQATNLLLLEL